MPDRNDKKAQDPFRSKKRFGQHWLQDGRVARRTAEAITDQGRTGRILEVGPGLGALSIHLLQKDGTRLKMVEYDKGAIDLLIRELDLSEGDVIQGDFLELELEELFEGPFVLTGNFPYNISSQILVRLFDHCDRIPEMVGMFQKEVADRVVAPPGSKVYGRLSVLLGAFYERERLFKVPPGAFSPAPKVNSAVIRLQRNERETLPCSKRTFSNVVKAAFGQRRKVLSNALKGLFHAEGRVVPEKFAKKRAEELEVEDFIELATILEDSHGS